MIDCEMFVLVCLVSFLIGMVGIAFVLATASFFEEGFSPMGPCPSPYEQMKMDWLEERAEYKEEYVGVVPVNTYRWSGEKEITILMGRPTIISGMKYIKYRKEWRTDEWKPYAERIDTKDFTGSWYRL